MDSMIIQPGSLKWRRWNIYLGSSIWDFHILFLYCSESTSLEYIFCVSIFEAWNWPNLRQVRWFFHLVNIIYHRRAIGKYYLLSNHYSKFSLINVFFIVAGFSKALTIVDDGKLDNKSLNQTVIGFSKMTSRVSDMLRFGDELTIIFTNLFTSSALEM